jgi:phospholipase C
VLKTIETRWQLPSLTARDASAPDVGDVLTLSRVRTDDPLAGVTVPRSKGANPAAGIPSHLQRVFAGLVAQLPGADDGSASGQPVTEQDYDNYIRRRVAEWTDSRR